MSKLHCLFWKCINNENVERNYFSFRSTVINCIGDYGHAIYKQRATSLQALGKIKKYI